ncbi:tRNA 2-thiouridine(34) synthase MnmA [bacterium]|nr:tRNA 2-thiouridine(34) synthase MnmA [bacterium]
MSDRVIVAMSGGVDSSVAAAMMKKKGYEVIGLTMQLGSRNGRCCSEQDILDARRVADALSIPHYTVSYKKAFQNDVIDYFVKEYIRGRTPNPCAVCNPKIKFGVLLNKVRSMGARYLVTGHYANMKRDPGTGRWLLKRGRERGKDQSYFLGRLSQDQLAHALFPVGNYPKDKIRILAEHMGLPVARKTESQEICFVPESGVARFIENERGEPFRPGKIIQSDGKKLGEHQGIIGYTIGQRKGLGISAGRPIYVTHIDGRNHTITVGDNHELYHDRLIASEPNWIAVPELVDKMEVRTRIRYKHRPALSTIEMIGKNRICVHFRTPQRAITPGQLAVFYQKDIVIGSAWIEHIER